MIKKLSSGSGHYGYNVLNLKWISLCMLLAATQDLKVKFMTVTIRTSVIAGLMFIIWLAVSILIDESVFNISLFCNSHLQHKIQTIGTNETTGDFEGVAEGTLRWNSHKFCEDEETGENLNVSYGNEMPSASSHSISYDHVLSGGSENTSINFAEKNTIHSSTSLNFSKKKEKSRDPIVRNAVWPFCWFGGKTEEEMVRFSIPDVPSPDKGAPNLMVQVQKLPKFSSNRILTNADSVSEEPAAGEMSESERSEVEDTVKVILPKDFHVAESLPESEHGEESVRNGYADGVEKDRNSEFAGMDNSAVNHVDRGEREVAVSEHSSMKPVYGMDSQETAAAQAGGSGAATGIISEENMSADMEKPSYAMEESTGNGRQKYGEMRPFPVVTEEGIVAGEEESLVSGAGLDGVQDTRAIAGEMKEYEMNENEFQDLSLKQAVEGLVEGGFSGDEFAEQRTYSVSGAEEMGRSVLEEGAGNFPVSPGEPETAPITGHWGVKKPVAIPDVPMKEEGIEDVLVIEDVSELELDTGSLEYPER